MTRRRKQQGKTFQQRQTERKLRAQHNKQELDTIVEDMAAIFACSLEAARDFADQCNNRLDDLDYDLACGRTALDFWADAPSHAAPLVEALRELVAERERHAAVLVELRQRLRELTRNDAVHHHLVLPAEHYQNQIRIRLFPESGPRPVQNCAVSDAR